MFLANIYWPISGWVPALSLWPICRLLNYRSRTLQQIGIIRVFFNSFKNDGISWRVKRTHIVVNKVNKYILNYLLGISHGFVLTKPLSDGCKSHSLITRSRTLQRYFGYSKVSSPFPKMVESHGRSNASYCRR